MCSTCKLSSFFFCISILASYFQFTYFYFYNLKVFSVNILLQYNMTFLSYETYDQFFLNFYISRTLLPYTFCLTSLFTTLSIGFFLSLITLITGNDICNTKQGYDNKRFASKIEICVLYALYDFCFFIIFIFHFSSLAFLESYFQYLLFSRLFFLIGKFGWNFCQTGVTIKESGLLKFSFMIYPAKSSLFFLKM